MMRLDGSAPLSSGRPNNPLGGLGDHQRRNNALALGRLHTGLTSLRFRGTEGALTPR